MQSPKISKFEKLEPKNVYNLEGNLLFPKEFLFPNRFVNLPNPCDRTSNRAEPLKNLRTGRVLEVRPEIHATLKIRIEGLEKEIMIHREAD